MKTYEFDLILNGVSEITDEQADLLFANGCDDGTPVSRGGVAWIHFDRSAASLEVAIQTAVTQVRSAGVGVLKVELDMNATAYLETAT